MNTENSIERAIKYFVGACIVITLLMIALTFMPSSFSSEATGEKSHHPRFGFVEFKTLKGDGFLRDPMRTFVVDGEGYVLAATPVSYALSARCVDAADARRCYAYDEELGLLHEPDFTSWKRGNLFHEGRRVSVHPLDNTILEYGFTSRQAGIVERLWLDAVAIIKAPRSIVLGIMWWFPSWLFLLRIYRRWKANGWRIGPIDFWSGYTLFLEVLGLSVLCLIALFSYAFDPYSLLFFLVVFTSAGMLALLFARMRMNTAS